MYVVTGDPLDLLCKSVHLALESAGYEACLVANPMLPPFRFVWRLDTLSSVSRLILEDETVLSDSQISAVLVRRACSLSEGTGDPDDLAYIQEEADAAFLAWLWSLDCVVVNRYPPGVWYRQDQPLLLWRHLLERCGLRALDSIISNASVDLACGRTDLGAQVTYVPLTREGGEFLNLGDCSENEPVLGNRVPAHFMQPGTDQERLCVIGSRVVWDGRPYANRYAIESALACFCELAGLTFLEVVLKRVQDETRVAAVNPHPRLEDFTSAAQSEIVVALVSLLTGSQLPNFREAACAGNEEPL